MTFDRDADQCLSIGPGSVIFHFRAFPFLVPPSPVHVQYYCTSCPACQRLLVEFGCLVQNINGKLCFYSFFSENTRVFYFGEGTLYHYNGIDHPLPTNHKDVSPSHPSLISLSRIPPSLISLLRPTEKCNWRADRGKRPPPHLLLHFQCRPSTSFNSDSRFGAAAARWFTSSSGSIHG